MQNATGVDPRAHVSALFNALARFAVSLRPEQADQIINGDAKLALIVPGQHIVDPIVGLDQALKLLRGLSEEDQKNIISKTAKVVLQRPGQQFTTKQQKAPLDLDAVATAIESLPSEEAVVKHLNGDSRLTGPMLKQLCGRLNIDIPSHVKQKPVLQRLIADEVIGHRRRTLGY